ncbi:hypothetical protein CYMTET_55855 [Cymbomonas tetramitiformis]|uniref:Uncharacterized protein n=1 Tax=Cymbomonas tetramitiformis TaxID=36881 RepID=A0AAE0BD96_9CHLO|nr:hypothetical protein CYMTET_55855 [Cymbomonas tetramitiformis]
MGIRPGAGFVGAMSFYGIVLALAQHATASWAGVCSTFDLDDVFQCPSLAWLCRSLRNCDVAFSPRHYPYAPQRTTSHQAFRIMVVHTRAKRSLTRDSDIDASLRLTDAVRNTPTARSPAVTNPDPNSNTDADVATRKYLQEQSKLVDEVYKGRLHRTWAKGIREDILGDKKHYFSGTTDAGLLSDVVVQLRTEFESAGLDLVSFDLDDPQALVEHAALGYPANVDPQPILAREQRLVRDNKAADWTPTEATRKLSLYSRLDPVFYAAVKVRYPMVADLASVSLVALRSLVVEIYQAWAQTDVGKAFLAKPAGGDTSALLTSSEHQALLDKINELTALVQQRYEAAPPVVQRQQDPPQRQQDPPQRQHGQRRQQQQRGQSQRGFRMGVQSPPAVGYDRDEQRAKPLCTRCKKTGKDLYHFYRDCPLGGRQHSPTSAAAFCVPIDEVDAEGVHALAMCALFQEAADDGAEAFARAATAYGPPAVLCGGVVGGIDVSAYGFSVDAVTPVAAGGDASALVCDTASAGITPEEQVPAGGAAAPASAVPAPAMPVLENEQELLELYGYGPPVSLQSTRVTTTEKSGGEFAGVVEAVNHAAVAPVDLTGYDTDDYEDFADGSFAVKPRAPAVSANHASEPAAHVPESGGASRTYGCGKPPWGFPAHAGPWGFHYLLSLFLFISIMGVGAAAYTAANDIGSVQVSGRAAPQPVLCRGDLCIYPSISELDPVTLDAVLHSLGATTVVHRPPDPLESSAAS